MLLHRDGLIELTYEVTTDVLFVKWPDLSGFTLSEIRHSFNKLIDTLKHYDIKRLLIDSRAAPAVVTDEEHKDLAFQFAQSLLSTRLQKVARVTSLDPDREKKSQQIAGQITQEIDISFVTQTFQDTEAALTWLQSV